MSMQVDESILPDGIKGLDGNISYDPKNGECAAICRRTNRVTTWIFIRNRDGKFSISECTCPVRSDNGTCSVVDGSCPF